ncbi:apolipoprotein C-I isoform X1 [Sander lucioperca]|uniref:Apolipoprotein C-I n=1 Tax=Sander lucioperca TaxID=283035 RepID=A0A8D0A7W7_SANLU|nr:apolipoprotein C-I isoform X1 [Sander lucioperca]
MRLYLAVAVLMLAFVAYTEAQEETIEQRFAVFQDQMAEMGKNLAEKAKTTFEQFQTSDLAVKSQNWFREQYESLKAKMGEIGQ